MYSDGYESWGPKGDKGAERSISFMLCSDHCTA